jgi:hypothetical protein
VIFVRAGRPEGKRMPSRGCGVRGAGGMRGCPRGGGVKGKPGVRLFGPIWAPYDATDSQGVRRLKNPRKGVRTAGELHGAQGPD